MSSPQTSFAPTATAFAPAAENQVAPAANRGLGRGGVGKQKEALKLRLDLNLEVEIAIQAKVNGDITLSLLTLARRGETKNRKGNGLRHLEWSPSSREMLDHYNLGVWRNLAAELLTLEASKSLMAEAVRLAGSTQISTVVLRLKKNLNAQEKQLVPCNYPFPHANSTACRAAFRKECPSLKPRSQQLGRKNDHTQYAVPSTVTSEPPGEWVVEVHVMVAGFCRNRNSPIRKLSSDWVEESTICESIVLSNKDIDRTRPTYCGKFPRSPAFTVDCHALSELERPGEHPNFGLYFCLPIGTSVGRGRSVRRFSVLIVPGDRLVTILGQRFSRHPGSSVANECAIAFFSQGNYSSYLAEPRKHEWLPNNEITRTLKKHQAEERSRNPVPWRRHETIMTRLESLRHGLSLPIYTQSCRFGTARVKPHRPSLVQFKEAVVQLGFLRSRSETIYNRTGKSYHQSRPFEIRFNFLRLSRHTDSPSHTYENLFSAAYATGILAGIS
ncbi:uncharacterized protein BT62DRAFT_1005352 [Guyanagaster necrorhizus]|uniref:Uncharacterized protein n=1 Tax=Guyanagaster necrorhizus TaxID=856835 RepID=A0A9P7VV04_9AGAR|nr:uncharacterized protein BT62DRAFT_1005352 [Guyanagaster necrorhizus MCA 3950]KAG7446955.1 hypothetical protein BT62DRAFT_1005352 [Guyanagaster necrorhizus MCA 3950]